MVYLKKEGIYPKKGLWKALQQLAKFIKNMFYNMFFYLVSATKCLSFVTDNQTIFIYLKA